ncbi:hypothetical protein SAMN05192533_102285 [Mesobacillus persicus]|uniref:Uncharacterized protein n=1 Tax=Mesobacillus persicus TaxID=930146 RepID=A0A1H7XMM6_9BACI|nr:hypothetical protein [Mesobacillus persicus]SEM35182.1 hypothetical protein SAMN05192533_102285 [Mesobacillus persicus]
MYYKNEKEMIQKIKCKKYAELEEWEKVYLKEYVKEYRRNKRIWHHEISTDFQKMEYKF